MFHSKQRSGFTLVELLVVIAIIALLTAIAIPAVLMAQERARRLKCASNLKGLGEAIVAYEDAKVKHQYPGWINKVVVDVAHPKEVAVGWPIMILDRIDRRDLLEKLREDGSVSGQVSTFMCPSADLTGDSPLSYVANCGQQDAGLGNKSSKIPPDWAANGVFFRHYDPGGGSFIRVKLASDDLEDGQQYTLLLSENLQAGSWTDSTERLTGMLWWLGGAAPAAQADVVSNLQINANMDADRATVITGGSYNYARPSSNHPGGVNAVFCDGHVQFLNQEMDYHVYAQLMASDDAEVLYAGSKGYQNPVDLRNFLDHKLSEESLE